MIKPLNKARIQYAIDKDGKLLETLDSFYVNCIYSHCSTFKQYTNDMVDADNITFIYDGVIYTLDEGIDVVLKCCSDYLSELDKDTNIDDQTVQNIKFAVHLYTEMFESMWW